jgi:hypothetical protein
MKPFALLPLQYRRLLARRELDRRGIRSDEDDYPDTPEKHEAWCLALAKRMEEEREARPASGIPERVLTTEEQEATRAELRGLLHRLKAEDAAKPRGWSMPRDR